MESDLSLSIIVPCYNVEKYLSKCIDSLLFQDIPADTYEIILIDDGSTDGTLKILEKYAYKNKNISVITQENKGIGAARNRGIFVSKGKYILFVDADDFLNDNVLSVLIKRIEKENLEALRFNFNLIDKKNNLIAKKRNSTFSIVRDEEVVNGETFLTDKLGWACYVWSFIYDAKFIKQNNLLFREGIVFEDVDWLVRMLLITQRVTSFDLDGYSYLQRQGSITQSINPYYKNKTVSDKLFVVNFLKKTAQSTKNNRVSSWCKGMISLIFIGILAYVENELPERKKEIISLLHEQRFLPLKSYRFTLKQMRDLRIINFSPRLYCFLKKQK